MIHPDAALSIWQPLPGPDVRLDKKLARLRVKGLIQGLVGLGLGVLIFFFWSRVIAYVSWSISSFVLLSALISPGGVYDGISRFFIWLGVQFARVATPLVLVPNFFLVFFPLGVITRRGKKDRLERWMEPDADSYWKDREHDPDNEDTYIRQF